MTIVNRKSYQDNWYNENKKRVQDKKRYKYVNDPEYRRKAKHRSKVQRQNLKNAKVELVSIPMKDGSYKDMYSIISVSIIIGKARQTIASWEANNKIPKCYIYNRSRYYTEKQTELLLEYVAGRYSDNRTELITMIYKNWRT